MNQSFCSAQHCQEHSWDGHCTPGKCAVKENSPKGRKRWKNKWTVGSVKKKKKNNWTGSVHQFSLWGKLKLLGSYDPGNIQLPVRGDSCSWLNHQNQLRKWNSLTLFWSTTHHLMQRSCSESLQTLRRARKVLSAPKMSGPFHVSQNPRMSPTPCVGKILRAWKSRITLFNKVGAERKAPSL